MLIHRTEAQHVAERGTLLSNESDPPTVYHTRMRPGWQFHLPRFSLACVETVLSESLFSCAPADVPAGATEGDGREAVSTEAGRLPCDNRELDDESTVAALKAHFVRLPLPAYAQ